MRADAIDYMDEISELVAFVDSRPEKEKWEILDGMLVMQSDTVAAHGRAQAGLAHALFNQYSTTRYGGPGGWVFITEAGLRDLLPLSPRLRPDIAAWRQERFAVNEKGYANAAPDWVCEILSPSTAGNDRLVKRRIYAQMRIPAYWLVDLAAARLNVLALGDEDYEERSVISLEDGGGVWPFIKADLRPEEWR